AEELVARPLAQDELVDGAGGRGRPYTAEREPDVVEGAVGTGVEEGGHTGEGERAVHARNLDERPARTRWRRGKLDRQEDLRRGETREKRTEVEVGGGNRPGSLA